MHTELLQSCHNHLAHLSVLQESLHVCRLYNRLATALLQFEGLWLDRWRASVSAGREGLKATLLVQEAKEVAGQSVVVRVNCHHRYWKLP